MSKTGQPGVLPLRPLTAGELLDAAVSLFRTRGPLLLGIGAAAAVAEQAILFPLRRLADVDIFYFPPEDRWAAWALLIAVGVAAEAAIIAGIGGWSGRLAPRALLGAAAPRPEPPGRPALATALVAAIAGLVCGLTVATLFLWPTTLLLLLLVPVTVGLWVWGYGLLGLAVPAVVIDRLGPLPAILRSVRLSARGFLRSMRIRVLAYLGWFVIRIAWGVGLLGLFGLVYSSPNTTVDNLLMAGAYLIVNAFMYPILACLDTVLHLEARMRTEGLDIALRRALHRSVDATNSLVGT